ncbi:MAG: hypothetical protein VKJ06_08700 [Vampirovibrionales bacterium]|nr:hypothetical protein [Vampirovibrionales bacterium]
MANIQPITRLIGGVVAYFAFGDAFSRYKTYGRTFRQDAVDRYWAQQDLDTFQHSQYQFSGMPMLDKTANWLRWGQNEFDKSVFTLKNFTDGIGQDLILNNLPQVTVGTIGLYAGFRDWIGATAKYAWRFMPKTNLSALANGTYKAASWTTKRVIDGSFNLAQHYGKLFAKNPLLTAGTTALAVLLGNQVMRTNDGTEQRSMFQNGFSNYNPYLPPGLSANPSNLPSGRF